MTGSWATYNERLLRILLVRNGRVVSVLSLIDGGGSLMLLVDRLVNVMLGFVGTLS